MGLTGSDARGAPSRGRPILVIGLDAASVGDGHGSDEATDNERGESRGVAEFPPENKHEAQGHLEPRERASDNDDGPNWQELVGAHRHLKQELVVGGIDLGEARIDEKCAERQPTQPMENAPGHCTWASRLSR